MIELTNEQWNKMSDIILVIYSENDIYKMREDFLDLS